VWEEVQQIEAAEWEVMSCFFFDWLRVHKRPRSACQGVCKKSRGVTRPAHPSAGFGFPTSLRRPHLVLVRGDSSQAVGVSLSSFLETSLLISNT
jgi:hypothetical protein